MDPGLRACEEIVLSRKHHSGAAPTGRRLRAARRQAPGRARNQKIPEFPIYSTSGAHGFRARGQCPRPGMTTFGIFSHAPSPGKRRKDAAGYKRVDALLDVASLAAELWQWRQVVDRDGVPPAVLNPAPLPAGDVGQITLFTGKARYCCASAVDSGASG
jgi:hypothetical protein